MDTRIIGKDISIFYVNATSFPQGVLEAFEKLHEHFPFSPERNFYGLSRPENGQGIVYKAAAEVKNPEELVKYRIDTMNIPRGTYITELVHDFKENIPAIGATFEKLMQHPGIDPQGYCIEWYLPDDRDVLCMIRVINDKQSA